MISARVLRILILTLLSKELVCKTKRSKIKLCIQSLLSLIYDAAAEILYERILNLKKIIIVLESTMHIQ